MFHLPPQDSDVRSLFHVEDLASVPALRDAYHEAKRAIESGARRVHAVCRRPNDDIVLAAFGPRGGTKVLWNFTTGRKS